MVWGKTGSADVVSGGSSLLSIMSEQKAAQIVQGTEGGEEDIESVPMTQEEMDIALALKLSLQEELAESTSTSIASQKDGESGTDHFETDFALAMQLQEEEEASMEAFRRMERGNMQGKVALRTRFQDPYSYSAHQVHDSRLYSADDAEEVLEETVSISTAVLSAMKPKGGKVPPWPVRNKNLKGQGGDEEIVTKHDAEISGKKNWEMLGSETARMGDFVSNQHKLSNRVYNSFKHNMKRQQGTVKGLSATVERETIQTRAKGLDQKNRLILQKMVNLGLLDEVTGVVRTGKEAIVYHAFGNFENRSSEEYELVTNEEDDMEQPVTDFEQTKEEVNWCKSEEDVVIKSFAIKVFKTTLNEFKNRLNYVRGDHRFVDIERLSKQNPRKVVSIWAEKEIRNLSRARQAGIPCPYPVRLYSTVLVMEFIGEDGWAAPRLKEVELSPKRFTRCYLQVLFMMHALATKCNLVHADLSEYNLLYMRGSCFLIDMGQAVMFNHPNAHELLLMDCRNVTNFFKANGVERTIDPEVLAGLLFSEVESAQRSRDADQQQITEGDTYPEVAYAEELGSFACTKFAAIIGEERARLRAELVVAQA